MTPTIIATIVQAAITYGPAFAQDLIALFKKKDPTIADVEALFAKVQPYASYGIPDVVPPPAVAPNAMPNGPDQTA